LTILAGLAHCAAPAIDTGTDCFALRFGKQANPDSLGEVEPSAGSNPAFSARIKTLSKLIS
jgi:hypothetical protein